MPDLSIKIKLDSDAVLPSYATPEAAGLDLCTSADFSIQPGERKLIPTGLRMEIPPGFEGQIRPRSGLALKHGIGMVNSPGTIDSDYRGEIGIILINHGSAVFEGKKGERIAQIIFAPVSRAEIVPVKSLGETGRGEQGFGSSGLK